MGEGEGEGGEKEKREKTIKKRRMRNREECRGETNRRRGRSLRRGKKK